jgi:hypothetical protein
VRSRKLYRGGLSTLLPVVPGHERPVRELVRGIPTGEDSPFARLECTHFARLVLVPAFPPRDEGELGDPPACLFFSAEFDIPVAGYVEALCTLIPGEADAIFEHCVGYPGTGVPPAFGAWLSDHRVPAGFSVHGNPEASVDDVLECLRLRDRIIAFAVDTRALDPAALKEQWDLQDWEAPA